LAAGFTTAFATANHGNINGGIGLFAAAVLAMIVAPSAARVQSFSWLGRVVAVLVLASIPLGQVAINAKGSYRAGPVATHTAKVSFGPYRWLRSAPDTVRSTEELTSEVRATLPPDAKRMLVYYDFPAPYLAAPVRPALPTVWTDSRAQISVLLPYYAEHRTGTGIAFAVTGTRGRTRDVEDLVESPGRLLRDKGWFRIYREPPP
jgi:hypothetical protein